MSSQYTQLAKAERQALGNALLGQYTTIELYGHIRTIKNGALSMNTRKEARRILAFKLRKICQQLEPESPLLTKLSAELRKEYYSIEAIKALIPDLVEAGHVFSTEYEHKALLWKKLAESMAVYPKPEQYIKRIVDLRVSTDDNSSLRLKILRQFLPAFPKFADENRSKKKSYAPENLLTSGSHVDETVFDDLDALRHQERLLIANYKKLFNKQSSTNVGQLKYILSTMEESLFSSEDYALLCESGWPVQTFDNLTAYLTGVLSPNDTRLGEMRSTLTKFRQDVFPQLTHCSKEDFSETIGRCMELLQYLPTPQPMLEEFSTNFGCAKTITKNPQLLALLRKCQCNPSENEEIRNLQLCALSKLLQQFNQEDWDTLLLEASAKQTIDVLKISQRKRKNKASEALSNYIDRNKFIDCANNLASGLIGTTDTLTSLFLFAFAFGMFYHAFDPSHLNVRNLLRDFYSDNLLRYLTSENRYLSKEPTLGFNPKNYAQVIYFYYLNQDGSADSRLCAATSMLQRIDEFAKKNKHTLVQQMNTVQSAIALDDAFFKKSEDALFEYLTSKFNVNRFSARDTRSALSIEHHSKSLMDATSGAANLLETTLQEFCGKKYILRKFFSESPNKPLEKSGHLIGWENYLLGANQIIRTYLPNTQISKTFKTVMDELQRRLAPTNLKELNKPSRTKILCLTFWTTLFQNVPHPDDDNQYDAFVPFLDVWSSFSQNANVYLEQASLPLVADDSKILMDQVLAVLLFCLINRMDD